MSLLLWLSVQSVFAQSVFLAPDVDLREIPSHLQPQLYGTQQLSQAEIRGVRDELMFYTHRFLNHEMTVDEFEKWLWSWSQSGWSDDERWILVDTLKKWDGGFQNKEIWLCRLNPSESCKPKSLDLYKLPKALREFEGLILDGKAYPFALWGGIKITDAFYQWTFVSSKYASFQFRGTWKQLQEAQITLNPLVQGTCNNPLINHDIQSLRNQVLYSLDCIKPSLPPAPRPQSFYKAHKKSIWWGVGIILGAGLITQMKGKTIVIDKPGFM